MRRVISVYLPTWPTDRLRLGNTTLSREQPLVTVARDGSKKFLASVDKEARKRKLCPGQTLAHAQSFVSDLLVVDADVEADQQGIQYIALKFLELYSPIVAVISADTIWLDVSGCCHFYGGEEGLLHHLLSLLSTRQINARATIADTFGAAFAYSKYVKTSLVMLPSGKHRKCLEHLPMAALRLPYDVADDLKRMGLFRIGQLYDKPTAPLTKRFGKILLYRLDQALGNVHEPIKTIETPDIPTIRRVFAEPVANPDYIAKVIDGLASDLCKQLEDKNLGARRLDLIFYRVDGTLKAIRVGTVSATRQPKHIIRLLAEHLDKIEYGFGIEALTLRASLADRLKPKQCLNDLAGAEIADLSGLIDILRNRLGNQQVYQITPIESDVPERSIKRIPALSKSKPTHWPTEWQRPARLLKRPEKIEVTALLPDHAPRRFVWRNKPYLVKKAETLEAIYGEWWKDIAELPAVRSYFQVEDEKGGRYWLFRRGDGIDPTSGNLEWFLHGIFA